eukprot:TRINITY_DN966_c0_g1_i1.p1 TRINITY_DN966_c0_g1~~TRINITY_DN966_c0_g1_i1.p1  ORF type:complete len:321 (-),score=68.29 TRINITY_DN966_c0_g1_i1:396-1358(-)
MGYDDIAPEEKEAIATLRGRIGPPAESLLDDFLLRFLYARKNWKSGALDVDASTKMLSDHLGWRATTKAHDLVNCWFSPTFTSLYQCAYHGKDKFGNQVFFERPGAMNIEQLFSNFDEDAMTKLHLIVVETGRRFYDRALGGTGNGVVVVMDLGGLSRAHLDRRVINWIRGASAIDSANYPEHLVKAFIINAGWVFRGAWTMIRPMLDARTASKVEILGGPDQYLPKLLEQMDASVIPEQFSGQCDKCPNGCLTGYRFGNPDEKAPAGAISFSETEARKAAGLPLPVPLGGGAISTTGAPAAAAGTDAEIDKALATAQSS